MNIKQAIVNHHNTTAAGAAIILIAIGQLLLAIFDGDASTAPDFNLAVAEIVAGVGLLFSADGSSKSP